LSVKDGDVVEKQGALEIYEDCDSRSKGWVGEHCHQWKEIWGCSGYYRLHFKGDSLSHKKDWLFSCSLE